MAEKFANSAITTLGAAITTTNGTSLTVVSSTPFPSSGNFRVLIDSELLLVTAVSGTTWTVTRGAESTTAATHPIAATVTHILTAAALTQLQAEAAGSDPSIAIHAATGKTTPVDADELGLVDSAASNALKKVTWANVKATLKAYFDTLYAALSHTHAASDIASGTVATARLGSGSASATTFLRGDQSYVNPFPAGRLPYALTRGAHGALSLGSQVILAANGGSIMLPVDLETALYLDSVVIRNNDTSLARSWEWRLFLDDGSGATLPEVAGANGSESFTATVASNRTSQVGSPPVTVAAGAYILVVRNTHASNTFIIGGAVAGTLAGNWGRTKTLGSALTTTLDLSTGWSGNLVLVVARLTARILGESSAF